jgi:integrase
MYTQQSHSILFYIRQNKKTKDGKVPLYVRITIDGLKNERVVRGVKILPDHWDHEKKVVKAEAPKAKEFNKKITRMRADLERHFDRVQAKSGIATPALVKESYTAAVFVPQIRNEKAVNIHLSESVDNMIVQFLAFYEKLNQAYQNGRIPVTERKKLLEKEKEKIGESLEELTRKANFIFDRKEHRKTFVLLLNEYLLNFMQLTFAGHRSPNTLEKWIGRKRRYIEFLQYRYSMEDMPLDKIEYKFIDEVYIYLLIQHKVIPNTATKYAQCVKELMDRAVAKGWVNNNMFAIFKCRYTDPHHDWLTMQELERLKDTDFKEEKLNIIRDVFLFSSFTGLSYQEVYTLKLSDIIIGIDGKKWISKNRQKTGGDETLPLLPLPLQLLDKYKDHPLCVRRGRLLPVPTNEHYNRCLKQISKIGQFNAILKTHKARYFFANEVAYNNGVPLKTVSKMLGHKSVKTTEVYVRANRQNISENMEMVEKKMFDEKGNLKNLRNSVIPESNSPSQNPIDVVPDQGAKVIPMK